MLTRTAARGFALIEVALCLIIAAALTMIAYASMAPMLEASSCPAPTPEPVTVTVP